MNLPLLSILSVRRVIEGAVSAVNGWSPAFGVSGYWLCGLKTSILRVRDVCGFS